MRVSTLLLLPILCSCASTVHRLPGAVETPGGDADGACESEQFLTLAKTRYQAPDAPGARTLTPRDDGTGVYPVGESSPMSVSTIEERLGRSPALDRHKAAYAKHDRDRWIAAGLGAGAATALAVGTILLVSAFDTETTTKTDGSRDEKQVISGGQAAAGGIIIGAGFGLGIGGILVAPTATERANADAARYVFRPPEDDMTELSTQVRDANARARERCAATRR